MRSTMPAAGLAAIDYPHSTVGAKVPTVFSGGNFAGSLQRPCREGMIMSVVTSQAHAAAVQARATATTTAPKPKAELDLRAAAMREYEKSAELKSRFISAEVFADVVARDKREADALAASKPPTAPAMMSELETGWESEWTQNKSNVRAAFISKDVFLAARRSDQRAADRQAGVHRQ